MNLTIKKMKMVNMEDWGYFIAYENNVCTEKFMASLFGKELNKYKDLIETEFRAQLIRGWISGDFYHYFNTEQEAESFIVITKLSECV